MRENGGPAFPGVEKIDTENGPVNLSWQGGMSLRDYFAAAALTGMCAGITKFCDDEPAKAAGIIINRPRDLSEIAYTYADAMLAERLK